MHVCYVFGHKASIQKLALPEREPKKITKNECLMSGEQFIKRKKLKIRTQVGGQSVDVRSSKARG